MAEYRSPPIFERAQHWRAPKADPAFAFPQDLRDGQVALLEARAEYEKYARTSPWSAEPVPGWEGDKQLHSEYRSRKAESPRHTAERHAEVARFRSELQRLYGDLHAPLLGDRGPREPGGSPHGLEARTRAGRGVVVSEPDSR